MDFEEDDAAIQEITSQEEQQLRRVYDLLCDYHARSHLKREYAQREEKLTAVSVKKPRPGVTEDMGQAAEITKLTEEMSLLDTDIRRLAEREDRKIRLADLGEALRALGKKCSKKELLDMIWEVDENLDGCVDWDEFRLMFMRNITDRSGLEPSKLYNMVQFMIFDQNENGKVSVDETMKMLYERYGRQRMEAKLRGLFGSNMQETGRGGGEIDFFQYLEAVERTQYQTFMATSMGRNLRSSKGK